MCGVAGIDGLHDRVIYAKDWRDTSCAFNDSGRGDDIEGYLFEDEGLQVRLNNPSIIFIRAGVLKLYCYLHCAIFVGPYDCPHCICALELRLEALEIIDREGVGIRARRCCCLRVYDYICKIIDICWRQYRDELALGRSIELIACSTTGAVETIEIGETVIDIDDAVAPEQVCAAGAVETGPTLYLETALRLSLVHDQEHNEDDL